MESKIGAQSCRGLGLRSSPIVGNILATAEQRLSTRYTFGPPSTPSESSRDNPAEFRLAERLHRLRSNVTR